MPTFVFTYRPPTDYQAGTPEGMADRKSVV